MTDEERRLADLLRQAVPQPPRPISADDIAARVAGRRKSTLFGFQPWLPALAAACVLLAIAGTSVWLISGRSAPSAPSAPAASRTATSKTATSNTVPSASASPSRTARGSAPPATPSPFRSGAIGAFKVRLLNGAPIGPDIVSGADAVYGREAQLIDRFDPSNGAVTAQAPADPNAQWPPLVTGRGLWQTIVAPGTVTVQLLDPRTLRRIGSSQIAAPAGLQWAPVLAANADASEIFLGNANRIYSLDPTSGAVEHQVDVLGAVGALAVSPDGSRLYVGANPPSSRSRLLVLDIRHGLTILSDTPLDDTVTGLLATSGGVWVTLASGMGIGIGFAPLTDLAHLQTVGAAGGGVPAFTTLAGGAVWLSGYALACADAGTGAVRAHAQQWGEPGLTLYLGSVQFVGGRYFASFRTNDSDQRGLAILTPPAACG